MGAALHGLVLEKMVHMPTNNLSLVFRCQGRRQVTSVSAMPPPVHTHLTCALERALAAFAHIAQLRFDLGAVGDGKADRKITLGHASASR